MAANVHVTSVDALGAFRSELVVFAAAALRVLDETSSEVARTRQWLRHEQRLHWEGEVRRRQKKLDQALQDLMGARLSDFRDDAVQVNAVAKARRAFHEAEDKLRAVKQWDRNYDLVAAPLVKQMGGLRAALEHDMPHALTFLANAQQALDAYSEKLGFAEKPAKKETTDVQPAAAGRRL